MAEGEKKSLELALEHLKSEKGGLLDELKMEKKISQGKSWQLQKYAQEKKEIEKGLKFPDSEFLPIVSER